MEPERRRRRPAVSCSLCRKRKIRCNRELPCSNCVRSKSLSCVYDNHPPLLHDRRLESHQTPGAGTSEETHDSLCVAPADQVFNSNTEWALPSSSAVSPRVPSTNASTLPGQSQEIESLKNRVRDLEEQLSTTATGSTQSLVSSPSSNINIAASQLGGTFHFHCESRLIGRALPISRGIGHKNRLFGQSHWINTISLVGLHIRSFVLSTFPPAGIVMVNKYQVRDMFEMIEPHIHESSDVISGLQKCKALARLIKSQRTPPWPTCLTTDLPPRIVADALVECYLRTTEKIYRILHIPSFRENYEALWVSSGDADRAFLVQVKLVFALGATTYDDIFTLRASAIQWIYEAQTWLSEPEFKSRLGIQYLQTDILLLLAREMVAVGGEPPWIAAGSLLRTAVSMGLHRDPVHLSKRTKLVSEMRRRLWNTILEILLQSSLSSGSPPLISLNDFDTEPPDNLDDDQLVVDDPSSRLEKDFTQVSIARALRKTFPCRLRVAKFLNDLESPGTYEETLRLDAELRASYRALSQILQACKSSSGRSPTEFELCAVDFIMRRYLSALHLPFFGPSLTETSFAFSRKVIVETSFKIWCTAYPPSATDVDSNSPAFPSSRDEFARLTACGFGFFRTVAWQASLIIAVELRNQLQEEESLCPGPIRSDLLGVLKDAKTWTMRCIEAGETNIKGYLGISLITAHIQGLMRRLTKDEMIKSMVKGAEEAEETCFSMLEQAAARCEIGEVSRGIDQIPLSIGLDLPEDWEFMTSEGLFDSVGTEPMTWAV